MRSMDKSDREAYWSARLEQSLGPLDSEQLAVGVRAAVAAERSGAPAEDALWEGKTAASSWELPVDIGRTVTDHVNRNIDWEAVTIVNPVLATVLKAALETAGIPVALKQGLGWIVGLTVGPEGEVSVFVPGNRVAEARELITNSRPIDFPDGD
jgi:Putative prokaryotic signal transducing protein